MFDLLPLVHVAWADGAIQKSERAAILRVLELRNVAAGSEGFTLIESLLEERPNDEYMNQSLAVLKELLAQGDGNRGAAIVELCQDVATAAGGFLGLGSKVSGEERELIERIAGELGDSAQQTFRQSLD